MAFTKIGYGQVEPNQLSGIKTGQIFASLPLDKNVDVLQQGEFMFYNYSQNKVTADDKIKDSNEKMTEAYLVYQEIKIYEDWLSYKDFAMIRVGDNYVTNNAAIGRLTSVNVDNTTYGDGSLTTGATITATHNAGTPEEITLDGHSRYGYRMDGIAPRLVKTNIGDIWTTNMIEAENEDVDLQEGKVLGLKVSTRNTVVLAPVAEADVATTMKFAIVKKYTMPDGQTGFKLQRIA